MDGPQMTIWCMRTACLITKATNTMLDYVIVIASMWQELVHEHALMLRYTCIFFLV